MSTMNDRTENEANSEERRQRPLSPAEAAYAQAAHAKGGGMFGRRKKRSEEAPAAVRTPRHAAPEPASAQDERPSAEAPAPKRARHASTQPSEPSWAPKHAAEAPAAQPVETAPAAAPEPKPSFAPASAPEPAAAPVPESAPEQAPAPVPTPAPAPVSMPAPASAPAQPASAADSAVPETPSKRLGRALDRFKKRPAEGGAPVPAPEAAPQAKEPSLPVAGMEGEVDYEPGLVRPALAFGIGGGVLAVLLLLGLFLPQYVMLAGLLGDMSSSLSGLADSSTSSLSSAFTSGLASGLSSIASQITDVFSPGMRAPGLFAALGAGAALGCCGLLFRGWFSSTLTTPTTLGLYGGAALGVAVWTAWVSSGIDGAPDWLSVLGYASAALGEAADPAGRIGMTLLLALFAFVGALIVLGVVSLVRRLAGLNPPVAAKIAVGQTVGMAAGLVALSICYYNAASSFLVSWSYVLGASLYQTYGAADIVFFLLVEAALVAGAFVLFMKAEGSHPLRMASLLLATFAVCLCIAYVGFIGFVGFIAAPLAQRLVGTRPVFHIAGTALAGAIMVLFVYVVLGIPLGALTQMGTGFVVSLAGAVFFLVTVVRGKEGARG